MKAKLTLYGILTVLGILLFHQGWQAPFVLDDVNKIVTNPDLHTKTFNLNDFVYRYGSKKASNRNDPSRPVPYMLYWLCWQIGGGHPAPFYILNLFLHLICALLVGQLVTYFAPNFFFYSAIASVWFLSLPLNAGAVSYAYALNDILSTALVLAALYLSYRKPKWYGPILTCYLLALASKQSVVVLPGLIFAIDFFTQKIKRERLVLYFLLISTTLLYLLIRFLHLGGIGDLEAKLLIPRDLYLFSEGEVIWKYYWRLFAPIRLTIQHDSILPATWLAITGWISLIVLSLIAFTRPVRESRAIKWLFLAFGLFLMVLLPTSSLMPTADLFVERRAYLASALAIIFMTVGLTNFNINKKILASLALIIIAVNSYVTFSLVRIKSSEVTLWNHVLSIYPRSTRALLGLSYYYLNNRQYSEAEKYLIRITEIDPKEPDAYLNLGAMFHISSNPNRDAIKALTYYQMAAQLEPYDPMLWQNIGYLFLELNKLQEAERAFKQSLQVQPKSWLCHKGLSEVYRRSNRPDLAKKHLELMKELKQ